MNKICLEVEEEFADIRIDKYLSEVMDSERYSRSYLQKLIKEGLVTASGKVVKANYKVTSGERIEVSVPDPEVLNIEPEDIPLDILYEDDDLLVVNKPKGMVVHPGAGHYTGTLVNALLFHCKDNLSEINGVLRPGIVHRIDMNTTGSLIVCKTNQAHNHIAAQLKDHSITRIYKGIVHGIIKEDEGTINAPIGRAKNDRKKMAIVEGGREAITHYKVIERFNRFTYAEFVLETGRTHQIRVHMASIHHPLLGDDVYGPAKCPIKGLVGQTLHAETIGFNHPGTGKYLEFNAPKPAYFLDLLENKKSL